MLILASLNSVANDPRTTDTVFRETASNGKEHIKAQYQNNNDNDDVHDFPTGCFRKAIRTIPNGVHGVINTVANIVGDIICAVHVLVLVLYIIYTKKKGFIEIIILLLFLTKIIVIFWPAFGNVARWATLRKSSL